MREYPERLERQLGDQAFMGLFLVAPLFRFSRFR
jgi:hypothetical protein